MITLILAGAAAGAIAPGAGAASLRYQFRFTSDVPGAPTGMRTHNVYSDWMGSKPKPQARVEFQLPAGARIHEEAMPVCRATADELFARGAGACPPETELARGAGTALTGLGPPVDPLSGDIRVFHGPGEFMPVSTAPGSDRVLVVAHLRIVEGHRLVDTVAGDSPPTAPGGPPDGRTTPKDIDVATTARAAASGLIVTPPGCPGTGAWTSRLIVTNEDGSVESAAATTPCRPRAAARSRMRLAVRPRRVRAGRRVRFRFRVRSADVRCRARVVIRFAGRRVRTNSRGRAAVVRRLRRARRYRARASRIGCAPAGAVVRVVR